MANIVVLLDTEARMGEMIDNMDLDRGGGDTSTGSRKVTSAKPKLQDMGITKKESHIAQTVANNSLGKALLKITQNNQFLSC